MEKYFLVFGAAIAKMRATGRVETSSPVHFEAIFVLSGAVGRLPGRRTRRGKRVEGDDGFVGQRQVIRGRLRRFNGDAAAADGFPRAPVRLRCGDATDRGRDGGGSRIFGAEKFRSGAAEDVFVDFISGELRRFTVVGREFPLRSAGDFRCKNQDSEHHSRGAVAFHRGTKICPRFSGVYFFCQGNCERSVK